MDIVTIDFETYYSKYYSLSKMTTEQYIRDPYFEAVGVAVKVNDEETEWFSGKEKKTKKFLQKFDWANSIVVAHNAMFDMAILNWHFDLRPKKIVDTLSMARAIHGTEVGGSLDALVTHYGLGAKGTEVVNALGKRRIDFTADELARYGGYCVNDVELTYKLFKALAPGFPLVELNLIDLTIRMFSEPVLQLDVGVLSDHLLQVQEKKSKLMSNIEADKDQLMSNPQLAEVLRNYGVEPPMKVSPTTGKQTYAFAKTDEAFKALLEHDSEMVQALVAARLGVKSTLEETRTQRFIDIAARGALPIPLKYYAAHTGRWGGSDSVNMQNLPRSSPLKHAIVAPRGYVIIDSDSSQIEARTLAWLAEQNDLVEAFDRGEDVYKIMASAIYGKPVDQITKDERFVGKTTILGAGYGMGANKFRAQLKNFNVDLPEEECQRIITVYRETYPMIPLLWKQAGNALKAIANGQGAPLGRADVLAVEGTKGIRLPNGLYIKYPNLRRWMNDMGKEELVYDTKKGRAVIPNRIYGGKVIENCIAEGTEVLTDRGWVNIEDVTTQDKVHDGVEFVSHGGIVYKSIQPCVSIDGVWMTLDHEVLTNGGWQTASQNPEPYRPDLRHVDGVKSRTQQRKETLVEISMRLWRTVHKNWGRRNQGNKARRGAQLRVYDQAANVQSPHQAWNVEASGVCGMAQHAGPLSFTYSQSMEELRRAWGYCVSSVAGIVRKLLAGYGSVLSARIGLEPQRQRQRVQPSKLRVGDKTHELHEQTQHRTQGRCYGVESQNGHSTQHDLLSTGERLASRSVGESTLPEKQVYDILDAGPRSRFVVRGNKAPFIVHNCCQALARIAIGEQMLLIAKKYKVVMTVHDAIACIVPKHEVNTAREFVELVMRIRPKWAPDLPLNCESGAGRSYGDC
jgi:DNA polymerase I-like protein with 3'-5' exonuclease and polymerase domains